MATLNLNKAEFLKSAVSPSGFLAADLPCIVFAGKSNVGKSSVINRLLQRKNFARVGDKPGKTIHVNYFTLDRKCYLVDLPGYGFAKVDKQEKIRWGEMMEKYFRETAQLRLTLHLVDIRHEPTQDDLQMNTFLRGMNLPFLVVATKADKISRGARMKYLAPICRQLQVQPWQVICVSSETGDGREQLLAALEQALTEMNKAEPNDEA